MKALIGSKLGHSSRHNKLDSNTRLCYPKLGGLEAWASEWPRASEDSGASGITTGCGKEVELEDGRSLE